MLMFAQGTIARNGGCWYIPLQRIEPRIGPGHRDDGSGITPPHLLGRGSLSHPIQQSPPGHASPFLCHLLAYARIDDERKKN